MTPHEKKNVLKQIVQIVRKDSPNISLLKSQMIFAIWLALSNVICSRITLSFGLNHLFSKSRHSCSKAPHFCFKSHHFCSILHHFCFGYKMRCKSLFVPLSTNRLFGQTNIGTDWILRFQNGCNKVVIEFRDVQFWSEIILLGFVRSSTFKVTRMISDQISLHSFFKPDFEVSGYRMEHWVECLIYLLK